MNHTLCGMPMERVLSQSFQHFLGNKCESHGSAGRYQGNHAGEAGYMVYTREYMGTLCSTTVHDVFPSAPFQHLTFSVHLCLSKGLRTSRITQNKQGDRSDVHATHHLDAKSVL